MFVLVRKEISLLGTAAPPAKLIHAGIRYLEQSWIHLKRFRLAAAVRNFIFVVKTSRERKSSTEWSGPHQIQGYLFGSRQQGSAECAELDSRGLVLLFDPDSSKGNFSRFLG